MRTSQKTSYNITQYQRLPQLLKDDGYGASYYQYVGKVYYQAGKFFHLVN
jgi:hypothetical protein